MMPESPTKTSRRAESPTKSGNFLAVSNGAAKRAASSPVRKAGTPFRRSPTKVETTATIPEVREQARQVLEKFLQRSLSENNAGRGHQVRNYYHKREGSDLSKIKESRNSTEDAEELSSPHERRGSYVAAVSEDTSSGKNDENKRASTGSLSSQKSHSMTVTANEKKQIREHLKSKKSQKKVVNEPLSPAVDYDFGDFTPNSTGQSRQSADNIERETSDDEDNIQKGRRKKSKFSQAKSRIRDSFLRKQRELGPRKVTSPKPQTPSEEQVSKRSDIPKPATSRSEVPEIRKKSPTPEDDDQEKDNANGGPSVGGRGSTDLEDESPNGYRATVHANSSPDGLNRINQSEKKTKTSFWDWFRPTKRKTKQKERQKSKSRSLDALTNPAYAVQNGKFTRLFSDEGPQRDPPERHLHKKHSFSGRCSFSGKTNGGLDRNSLKLSGLKVNKPRTPEPNDQKRVFPSDVVPDAPFDTLDAESPLDIPFHERTEAEQNEVYDLVASRLADIANNYGRDRLSPDEASGPGIGEASDKIESSTLAKDIAGILQGAADKHLGPDHNEQIEQMMVNAVKTAGYTKFKKELKHTMNSEPNLQQLAWFFDVTKGAVQVAGAGGQLALKVKEYSLRYFEDKFADWIIGRGGWDSMLSDEDGGTGEEDAINF